MQKIALKEKYPVYVHTIAKSATDKRSVDEVIEAIKKRIEAHPVATFIAIFDHYSHTKNLVEGSIAPEIKDAKNIVFCFGKELPKPELLGVRPRSIGVAETGESFIISFCEAPNPQANDAMMEWVRSLEA
jgi:hypothetical protein